MEAGVEAEGFHAVGLLAAFEVVLPAGMVGVEGADGEEEVGVGFGAVGGEAGVDGGEVLLEEGVVATGPGLGDAVCVEVVGESGGGVVWEAVVGPAVEVDVDVGDAGCGGGWGEEGCGGEGGGLGEEGPAGGHRDWRRVRF